MAKLYFRYGAMNSGKTTALIQVAHNYEERGMNVLVIKPEIDKKGDEFIVSRIGAKRKVDISAGKDLDLFQSISLWNRDVEKVGCVLVDEAQFMSSEQIDQLLRLTSEEEIPVICYGIRTDFRRELFTGSQRLFATAHTIEELKTICRCGKKAMFNARKVNDEYIFEGSQVAIDGLAETSYESLCVKCFTEELGKSLS